MLDGLLLERAIDVARLGPIKPAVMAIRLHNAPAHLSVFLMKDGRRWTDHTGSPDSRVDGRVNVMTTMAANLDGALSIQRPTAPLDQSLEPCSCGFALVGHGEAYNEQAFHHFLAIERKRSEASTRPFLLLLVEFEKHLGVPVPVAHDTASRLFGALGQSLRDTDVIGWYRDQRIAGAVLTDLGEAPQAIMPTIIKRVRTSLQSGLTAHLASLVRVRLYQLPARAENTSAEAMDAPMEFA